MQLNLFSRIKSIKIGTAATIILFAALLISFASGALLYTPKGDAAGQKRVSEAKLMAGGDDVTDPLEYTELMPGMLVNINTAGEHTLSLLPGIGETLAERIIAYREANGGFASADEIMNVNGIGEGTFEKIKELITVGDST